MKYLNCLFFLLLLSYVQGQIDVDYQVPHDDIRSLADADRPPGYYFNENGSKALKLYRNSYKSIAELSEKELRLGGLRINPITNISSRQTYYYKISLFDSEKQIEKEIENLPDNPRISNFSWSPNEMKIAFTNTTEKGVELWVVDIETGLATKLSSDNLNGNLGRPYMWFKDSKSLLTKVLPPNRNTIIDKANAIPSGPIISENTGSKAQNRTYQDLLKDKIDEQNFETLTYSELWRISLKGAKTKWKDKSMHRSISLSPDGNFVMVTTIHRPFSYIVTYFRFPTHTKIYDKDGNLVKTILEAPLVEEIPKGFMSTQKGPRSIAWRADKPATLYWTEALDDGDAAKEVEHRDAVYELTAPFKGEKSLLLKVKLRYGGIQWCDENLAIISHYWRNDRTLRTEFFDPSNGNKPLKLFNERNYQDSYSDPGYFVTRENQYGRDVILKNDGKLYLSGSGYSKKGRNPFVDEYHLDSGEKSRLYESDNSKYHENIIKIIDPVKGQMLVSLEAKDIFPDYYFRNFKTGSLDKITNNVNPFEAIKNIHKEIITYRRDDGLELSGTLYLPVGYESGKKYPMILWAYPREYKDKASASQVTSTSNQFTYPYYGSALFWVNRGYVVLDNAAFPIIGEGDTEPNDNFRSQLVSNAGAAINAVDELGYIDRDRVAVGGHSYGAFMVANLLSHSNLFAAGIARSGAYNRTLTPFGFQSEERSYWEAPDVYYTMSPFMHADKMKTPLLLIHGEADNNSGTYPMQSERYFNALKGLGATVRLVMLPKESHGYAARESIMHMLWEQDQWLEKHVKNKDKDSTKIVKP